MRHELMSPQEFLARHQFEEFPHSEEIFRHIREGTCVLGTTGKTISAKQLIGVYRKRIEHLRQFCTPHAIALRSDCEALCRELESNEAGECCIWSFSVVGREFIVFEDAKARKVMGCCNVVDKRTVTEEQWKKLWGNLLSGDEGNFLD